MGMRADLICFGPKKALQEAGCLDYPDTYYDGVDDYAIVAGTVAICNTSDQSEFLASMCGVGAWDLGNHCIGNIPAFSYDDTSIDGDTALSVYNKLSKLVTRRGVTIWYRPNG